MSEHHTNHHEHTTGSHEAEQRHEVHHQPEAIRETPEQKEHTPHHKEALGHYAKQEARSSHEYRSIHEDHPETHPHQHLVNEELRSMSRKRTLSRIRKDLSVPERTLSKLVHQPLVDTISEAGGKTLARPSGVLAGGICALFGNSFYLYICKHYGYHYNFLLFILLFTAGFVAGLCIELVWYGLRKRKGS